MSILGCFCIHFLMPFDKEKSFMYHDFETKTEAAIKKICWGLCGNAVAIKTNRAQHQRLSLSWLASSFFSTAEQTFPKLENSRTKGFFHWKASRLFHIESRWFIIFSPDLLLFLLNFTGPGQRGSASFKRMWKVCNLCLSFDLTRNPISSRNYKRAMFRRRNKNNLISAISSRAKSRTQSAN